MSKSSLLIIGLIFLVLSLSCKSLTGAKETATAKGPAIDFTTPGKQLDVKVQLDKKQTKSGKVSTGGGSVSLTSADGSKFTLDVPPNAIEKETEITLTAVQTLDGAPLDKNTPTAVQLEPSGLFFKEMATLTIVPGKEIPVKEQVMFVYEGEGKDYHLALIDPKSKEIKIKLMGFSGAGVASASDAAWAANLMIQASDAGARIAQRLGEYIQGERRKQVLEGDKEVNDGDNDTWKAALDQFEDEVLLKEMVAAELDCKHAVKAIMDLETIERTRQLLGLEGTRDSYAKLDKLKTIIKSCRKSYTASGGGSGVTITGRVEDINKTFALKGVFPGGTADFTYTPQSDTAGTVTYTGGGGGATMNGAGSYTLSGGPDGPLTMKSTLTGCVNVGTCRTTNEVITLTPVE